MDKNIIIELAEQEVFSATQYDLNPSERGFISLFSNDIKPRIKEISPAISYYSSLSEGKIERRYSIHYWEECAISAYDSLYFDFSNYLFRSIDVRELARREIKNVDLLLNKGKCQILPSKERLLINDIPIMYEKLITGIWLEFFIAEELESFETAHEESSRLTERLLVELFKTHKGKESFESAYNKWFETTVGTGPKFIDHFNSDWVAAMQIQALAWYKGTLKKISENGVPKYTHQAEVSNTSENRVNNMTMKTLRRSNDGYEAITKSFTTFVSKYDRKPQYGELMLFMVETPPDDLNISGKKTGKKVVELTIEGLAKPIDRDAFRKRFERYFKNMDNKQDVS